MWERREEKLDRLENAGPIMENAVLDFLLLLMGVLEEYQSELNFKK